MILNIESQDVEQLLQDVIQVTGESTIEAIRRALQERLQRLSVHATPPKQDEARFFTFLHNEIWAHIPDELLGTTLTKEEAKILGYREFGI